MFEWLFGGKTQEKNTYPVLTSEHLQPVDQPITTVMAKQLFKDWMLKIGYLDKQEVGAHVGYLAEEIRTREDSLKEDLQIAKQTMTEQTQHFKDEIKRIKKELASCKDDEKKAELEDALADAEDELEFQTTDGKNDIAEAQQHLDAFKADKREFLINYVNAQVHGGHS